MGQNWNELTKEEIFVELKGLMSNMFEVSEDDITMEARLNEDLDLDSIDAVDMVVEVKKKTGAQFKPEDFKQVRTVGDIVDVFYNIIHEKD